MRRIGVPISALPAGNGLDQPVTEPDACAGPRLPRRAPPRTKASHPRGSPCPRSALITHQHPDWPRLTWDAAVLAAPLAGVRHAQGRHLGTMTAIGFDARDEAEVETLTAELVPEHTDGTPQRSNRVPP
jgi:transposase